MKTFSLTIIVLLLLASVAVGQNTGTSKKMPPPKGSAPKDGDALYGNYAGKLEKFLEIKLTEAQKEKIRQATGTLEEQGKRSVEQSKYIEKNQPEISRLMQKQFAAAQTLDEPATLAAIIEHRKFLEAGPVKAVTDGVRAALTAAQRKKWDDKQEAIDKESAAKRVKAAAAQKKASEKTGTK